MSEKICGIYKIENKKTHQVYIGQSIDINRRWKNHRTRSQHRGKDFLQTRLYPAMYGNLENFEFSIVEECEKNELDEREIYWIDYYKSTVPMYGYNISSGGKISEEHRILHQKELNEIAELLATTDLTQTEIASKFGVGQRTVSSVNTGDYDIDEKYKFPIRDKKHLTGKIKESSEKKKKRLNGQKGAFLGTCTICGCACSTNAKHCLSCSSIMSRKVERPSKEVLSSLIGVIPMEQIGRNYGVSGTAIRKWCISYGIPFMRKDLKKIAS